LLAAFVLIATRAFGADAASSKEQCGTCHTKQMTQSATSMARALDRAGVPTIMKSHPVLTWQDGKYRYRIERRGEEAVYSVTDGDGTLSLPVHWVFGANSQTYVLEYGGHLYESRASYYQSIDRLDVTMGHQDIHPKTLTEAMGREISDHEARACFQCHSTGSTVNEHIQTDALTPGVQCAHCHEGATRHFQAISQGKLDAMPPKLSKLTAEDMSNFCGQCHRSWSEVVRSRLFGEMNVRFQPYRLASSKCFDGSDRRISCAACHDPHVELVTADKTYDSKCQACHAAPSAKVAAKPCPVARTGCVSCHMPKVQLPGGHQTFTDHFIRVVQANKPYPN
jgi:hypothetical protein